MEYDIVEQLKLHEGFKEYPYKDTEGVLTIGYGWNLEANGLPKDVCEELLEEKVYTLEKQLEKLEWYRDLNRVRQKVIIDMFYNLGNDLFEFEKMIRAIKEGDFERAAAEMEDSKWHDQVKTRAIRLEEMMRTGQDYKN